ncbi:MAG: transglycosylase SLT domain-containing protein [Pseudomonadota bacterium]
MTRTLAALMATASLSACATLTSPPTAQTSAPPEPDPVPPPALSAALAEDDAHIVDEPAPAPVAVAAEPPPPATLMDEIRDGFQLAHATDEKRVQQHLAWLERHPTYLERLRPRVERYLAEICADVRERRLPTELCLLPIIESALDPLAFSPGGAAGLWQFIPATGKRYGLKIDWWVDERRDPIAATDAALDYLQALHERFGDWTLAVAAYNCGEGRVARAVRRAGPDADFFDLKLPRETAAYVPRLLAFAAIAADPNGYEVALPFEGIPADTSATASVETGGQIDVARAADAVGLTVDELYALNPALNQWATHPDGPHRLIVPADRADAAQAALSAIPDDQRVAWSRHRIRPNQTLGGIALAYDTDVATLKRINQLSSSRIRAGDHLLIPTSSLAADAYPTPARTRRRVAAPCTWCRPVSPCGPSPVTTTSPPARSCA